MKTSKTTGYNPVPTAHVTVNKNRVKIYDYNNYYLKNGQTFEIELFNPTTTRVKAEITLNGVNMSDGGLIIRPGERLYLERFTDTNNKFVFETYEVEDTAEVKTATQKNGNLKVQFYKEMEQNISLGGSIWNTGVCGGSFGDPTYTYFNNPSTNVTFTSTNDTTIYPLGDMGNTTLTRCFNPNPGKFTSTFNNDVVGTTFNYYASTEDMVNGTNTASVETGRVEKGDASDQEFEYTTGNFNTYAFETVSYEIKPVSQKPITKETLTQVKRYCTECGAKVQTKFKFCPNCGEKQ